MPGLWTVWSQASHGPGAHFVVPLDAEARATGIKHALVRITAPPGETPRVLLMDTEPATAMPKTRRSRS